MYSTTHTTAGLNRSLAEVEPESRLSWLLEANAREAHRRSLFRNAAEEEQLELMSHPLSARTAYGRFGMLVGALPPAAIFIRTFGYGLGPSIFSNRLLLFTMCLAMNIVCCLTGRAVGGMLSRTLSDMERGSWSKMLIVLPFIGALWGAITGWAGGLVFFFMGAIFGLLCGIPAGMLTFTLFAPLHRLLARGGMIDARHFWPLACGTTMIVSALILGM